MSNPQVSVAPAAAGVIAALAEQCVKCGLCLPHCPTYRVMRVEGESPRGRIAYAHALATGSASLSPTMQTQLDDCLACGVCEAVCPSMVKYDQLIAATRSAMDAPAHESLLTRWVRRSAPRRRWWATVKHLRLPVWLVRLLPPRLQRLAELIPAFPAGLREPLARLYPARGGAIGSVALFRGCVASIADADTHLACARVLSAIGYHVHLPGSPHCCGALDRHAGDIARADTLAVKARAVLAPLAADLIVGTASGCQRDLRERVAPDRATTDVMALLANSPRLATLAAGTSAPLGATRRLRVAWFAPCTQAQAATNTEVLQVLAAIPWVDVTELPLQPRCCGAAGVYFVDHADIAEPLRNERIEQIANLHPDMVLTTNVGCRLYLQAGLIKAGLDIPVRHPIQLIADLLP